MSSPAPLTLDDFGSFTVGGREVTVDGAEVRQVQLSSDLPTYEVDPNGRYHVEHAYVQYFVPHGASGPPVVLVHGGGLTGACWETTPDHRPGWLHYFLRRGRTTFVVDGVERGRSGWCSLPGFWDEHAGPFLRSDQEAWEVFRLGPRGKFDDQETFPGSRFPVDHIENLSRQQVPRWSTTQRLSIAALCELLRRVGPSVLIGHSQGGGIAAHAASRMPERVTALVLLEPHGLPPADAFASAARLPQMLLTGDYLNESEMYRHLARAWHEYVAGLDRRGHHVTYADLPTMGIVGNSHMMMMDRNSEQVAELVATWLDDQVVSGQKVASESQSRRAARRAAPGRGRGLPWG